MRRSVLSVRPSYCRTDCTVVHCLSSYLSSSYRTLWTGQTRPRRAQPCNQYVPYRTYRTVPYRTVRTVTVPYRTVLYRRTNRLTPYQSTVPYSHLSSSRCRLSSYRRHVVVVPYRRLSVCPYRLTVCLYRPYREPSPCTVVPSGLSVCLVWSVLSVMSRRTSYRTVMSVLSVCGTVPSSSSSSTRTCTA